MALMLFDKPYAEKPPLSIWLTACSFRAFGESSLSGRLPHVLLASLSPAVLFAIGLGIAGTAEAGAAALLLSTSLLFLVSARLLLTDSALLFFDLLAVLAIQRVASPRRPFRWILLAALALGLALLAKGPLAYVAPGLFGIGTLLTRQAAPRATLAIRLALSIILGSVVALPWYVLAARSTAGASASSFLLREHLFRFTNVMEGHRGSPLLACGVLFFGAYPWSAAFLRLFRRRTLTTGPHRLGVWTWGLGILVLFSLSATFLPHYLLLAMPAFALLVVIAGPSASRVERRAVCCGIESLPGSRVRNPANGISGSPCAGRVRSCGSCDSGDLNASSPGRDHLPEEHAHRMRARRTRLLACHPRDTRPRTRPRPTRQGHEAPEAPRRARRRTQSPGTLPALLRRCENDIEVGLRGGFTRCGGRRRDTFRARLAHGSGSSRIRARSQRKNSSARFCRQHYRVRA
jgi:hypothetical protein